MIALLSGKLFSKQHDRCILDVTGVGYDIVISLQTSSRLPDIGSIMTLHIYTYVREDQLTLYGFIDMSEKEVFRKLITISGIGPRMAIALLSGVTTDDLVASIAKEDIVRLSSIPGIGKKTAERIVMELKDKLSLFPSTSSGGRVPISVATPFEEASSALMNLGYSKVVAETTLKKVEGLKDLPITEILKLALKELARA